MIDSKTFLLNVFIGLTVESHRRPASHPLYQLGCCFGVPSVHGCVLVSRIDTYVLVRESMDDGPHDQARSKSHDAN